MAARFLENLLNFFLNFLFVLPFLVPSTSCSETMAMRTKRHAYDSPKGEWVWVPADPKDPGFKEGWMWFPSTQKYPPTTTKAVIPKTSPQPPVPSSSASPSTKRKNPPAEAESAGPPKVPKKGENNGVPGEWILIPGDPRVPGAKAEWEFFPTGETERPTKVPATAAKSGGGGAPANAVDDDDESFGVWEFVPANPDDPDSVDDFLFFPDALTTITSSGGTQPPTQQSAAQTTEGKKQPRKPVFRKLGPMAASSA